MDDKRRALIDEIYSAFPAQRPHCFNPLVNSQQGEEPFETAEAFADKTDWTELDGKWIDAAANGWGTALTFLSDEAACFYLPAWLVAELHGKTAQSDPAFNLSYGFTDDHWSSAARSPADTNWADYSCKRWSHLIPAQVMAVVHFLEWYAGRTDDISSAQARQALNNYWRPRTRTIDE